MADGEQLVPSVGKEEPETDADTAAQEPLERATAAQSDAEDGPEPAVSDQEPEPDVLAEQSHAEDAPEPSEAEQSEQEPAEPQLSAEQPDAVNAPESSAAEHAQEPEPELPADQPDAEDAPKLEQSEPEADYSGDPDQKLHATSAEQPDAEDPPEFEQSKSEAESSGDLDQEAAAEAQDALTELKAAPSAPEPETGNTTAEPDTLSDTAADTPAEEPDVMPDSCQAELPDVYPGAPADDQSDVNSNSPADTPVELPMFDPAKSGTQAEQPCKEPESAAVDHQSEPLEPEAEFSVDQEQEADPGQPTDETTAADTEPQTSTEATSEAEAEETATQPEPVPGDDSEAVPEDASEAVLGEATGAEPETSVIEQPGVAAAATQHISEEASVQPEPTDPTESTEPTEAVDVPPPCLPSEAITPAHTQAELGLPSGDLPGSALPGEAPASGPPQCPVSSQHLTVNVNLTVNIPGHHQQPQQQQEHAPVPEQHSPVQHARHCTASAASTAASSQSSHKPAHTPAPPSKPAAAPRPQQLKPAAQGLPQLTAPTHPRKQAGRQSAEPAQGWDGSLGIGLASSVHLPALTSSNRVRRPLHASQPMPDTSAFRQPLPPRARHETSHISITDDVYVQRGAGMVYDWASHHSQNMQLDKERHQREREEQVAAAFNKILEVEAQAQTVFLAWKKEKQRKAEAMRRRSYLPPINQEVVQYNQQHNAAREAAWLTNTTVQRRTVRAPWQEASHTRRTGETSNRLQGEASSRHAGEVSSTW